MRCANRLEAPVLIIAVLCWCLVASARTPETGDLIIPCYFCTPAAKVGTLSATCAAGAAADMNEGPGSRWTQTQFIPPSKDTRWGPDLVDYAGVTAAQVGSCASTSWAQRRLMAAVNATIARQYNYCHHHAPDYVTGPNYTIACNPVEAGVDEANCVCNYAGLNRTRPWQGVDCSNFVAFVYNFVFGFYPTSSIGEQACDPTKAPGRLLNTVTVSTINQLQPGDLAFITLGSTGRTPPVRVSHVVIWTGLTVDTRPGAVGQLSQASLLGNLPTNQQSAVKTCMQDRTARGLPTYVIADSHHTGPNFRPFCGWYTSSFSHARRVIDPSLTLPKYDAAIAMWDDVAGSCMSKWALRT